MPEEIATSRIDSTALVPLLPLVQPQHQNPISVQSRLELNLTSSSNYGDLEEI
jgi:hypothetical protein